MKKNHVRVRRGRDRKRATWSLQAIFPSAKNRIKRDKDFLKGSAKSGHFFPIGKPQQRDGRPVFILGEGYATCASVHAATGHMVLVCFDTSNLLAVAVALRESQPSAWIVFAADNDTQTDGNPGVTKAKAAAAAVGGVVATPPHGDFNDLQQAEGLEAVKVVIEQALSAAVGERELAEGEQTVAAPLAGVVAVTDLTPGQQSVVLEDDETSDERAAGYFAVLGFAGDQYFIYHHKKRQVLVRSRHDFTEVGLVELAPREWWEANGFSSRSKGSINKTAAAEWLFSVAHKRGYFDLENRMRGRGAWNDKGRLVFHHGDHLTVDGEHMDLGKIGGIHHIYESKAPLPPVGTPATSKEGEKLLATAQMMRWVNPASAMFLCGWVYLASLGGALKWRPHIWITGESGSGKSHILRDFVGRLLGAMKLSLDAGDSSAAGIRQKLKRDALPVVLDEAEAKDDRGRERIRAILTLARGASTDGDTKIAKGTVSGHGLDFSVRSMFCFGAIGALAQDQESDNSRFATLAVRNKMDNSVPDQWLRLKPALYEIERDEGLPSRLLSRAILTFPMLRKCVGVFSLAAAKRLGSERNGDQFGALLAGYWCLTRDEVVTPAEAQGIVEGIQWEDFFAEQRQAAPDSSKCLDAILDHLIIEKGSTVSIRALVTLAAGHVLEGVEIDAARARRLLQDRGLTITSDGKNGRCLAIIRGSPAVPTMLKATDFASDWQVQLPRVKGYVPLKPTSFGPTGQNRAHGFPLSAIRLHSDSVRPLGDDEPPI